MRINRTKNKIGLSFFSAEDRLRLLAGCQPAVEQDYCDGSCHHAHYDHLRKCYSLYYLYHRW